MFRTLACFLVSSSHNISKTDTVSASGGKGKTEWPYFCGPVAYTRYFTWAHQNKIMLAHLSQPRAEKRRVFEMFCDNKT
jgi:hypothetical protein